MSTPVVDMDKVAKLVAKIATGLGIDLGRIILSLEEKMWRSERGANPGDYVAVEDASDIINSVVKAVVKALGLEIHVRGGTALFYKRRRAEIVMITDGKQNSHWGLVVDGKFVTIQAVGTCMWMAILTAIHVLLEPDAIVFFENRPLYPLAESVVPVQVGSASFHVLVNSAETIWFLGHKRPVPAPRPSRLAAAVGASVGGGAAPASTEWDAQVAAIEAACAAQEAAERAAQEAAERADQEAADRMVAERLQQQLQRQ